MTEKPVALPSQQPSPMPFSKGYKHRHGEPVSDACGDGDHAGCTQDLTKCHCTVRSGHTTMHAYGGPMSLPSWALRAANEIYDTLNYKTHAGDEVFRIARIIKDAAAKGETL